MNKELFELAAEISGISMIVTGLSTNLDKSSEHLTEDALHTALFGVSRYLDRIAEDLNSIEEGRVKNVWNEGK